VTAAPAPRRACRDHLPVDVDVAQRARLAPEALGESFNLGAPAPFLSPDGGRLLAALSGRELLEVRLPVRWRYDHAIGKAKGWIGYAPRGDLGTMMRDAWDVKRGDFVDYGWRD
jgi:hypothetical protein